MPPVAHDDDARPVRPVRGLPRQRARGERQGRLPRVSLRRRRSQVPRSITPPGRGSRWTASTRAWRAGNAIRTSPPRDVPLVRKVVDYRGAQRECIACHGEKDPHKGEFGRTCDSCHRPDDVQASRTSSTRAHRRFFAGQHEKLTCAQCHVAGKALRPVRTGASAVPLSSCVSSAASDRQCERADNGVRLVPHRRAPGSGRHGVRAMPRVDGVKFSAVRVLPRRKPFSAHGQSIRESSARSAIGPRRERFRRERARPCCSIPSTRGARRVTRIRISGRWTRDAKRATRPRRLR